MPSPFPGMDPYLEGSLWTTLHLGLSAEIVRQLAPKLRPHYIALPVERFVMEISSDIAVTTAPTYPDVGIIQPHPPGPSSVEAAVITAPLRLATIIPEAVPHVTVEIRDTTNRQLVTAIEILSPTNKRGQGTNEYLNKRQRLLLSSTHLLEIDLIRTGQRVPMQQPLPQTPYFIFLSRADERPMTEVWPVPLKQSLPIVSIPLLPPDSDITLDLQSAFTAAYDLPGYDLIVDYNDLPEVPLPDEDQSWAEQHLQSVRLR